MICFFTILLCLPLLLSIVLMVFLWIEQRKYRKLAEQEKRRSRKVDPDEDTDDIARSMLKASMQNHDAP